MGPVPIAIGGAALLCMVVAPTGYKIYHYFKSDPEVQEEIEQIIDKKIQDEEQIERLRKKSQKEEDQKEQNQKQDQSKDPELENEMFQKMQQDHLRKFYIALSKVKFSETLSREEGRRYCCFIGNTSAGKSSIINFLFDTKLKTGMGTTTKVADLVHKIENLLIYDAPGTNEQFRFYNGKSLQLFSSLDLVIVCFQDSVLNVIQVIKTLSAINKKRVILVRTKCNTKSQGEESPQELRKLDYEELQTIEGNTIKQIYQMGKTKEDFDAPEIFKIMLEVKDSKY